MIKKFFSATLVLALVAVVTMSYTFIANNSNTDLSADTIEMIADGNEDNVCCPPNWDIVLVSAHPTAAKWDRNGDGCLCHKAEGEGNDTPHGNGNEPGVNKSNTKDNNQPCKEGLERCGSDEPT